jgi:hypothetical protein
MNLTGTLLEQLDKTRELLEIAKRLDAFGLEGLRAELNPLNGRIIVYPKGLEQLHIARRALRRALGGWADRRTLRWASGRELMVSYRGEGVPVDIWVSFPLDDPPPKVLGPHCRVERRECFETTIVCDRKEERA